MTAKQHLPALHPAFSLIGNSTSDHSYQQIKVSDETGFHARALTWNTMNKCHARSAVKPYTNNPMNIDENLQQYKARKRAQLQKLFGIINHAQGAETIDCVFLQETDWTRMLDVSPKGSTDKTQKELCDFFIEELNHAGWGFILAPKTPSNAQISQQSMLTLYNKRTLAPVNNSGKGVLPSGSMVGSNPRFRGYLTTYTHLASGKLVDLVNFHLNYDYDHRQDLIQLMENSIANGHLIIMGGDANHPPNFAMDTLTGDWDVATAVDKDDRIFKATGQVIMTTSHMGVKQNNIAKHYDGFCAGAPQRLKIFKEAGEHFKMNHHGVRLEQDSPNTTHLYHQSEKGLPWMRGRALMVYLDNKLPQLTSVGAQKSLLNTMVSIALDRFNEPLQTAMLHKKYPLPHAQRILNLAPKTTPEKDKVNPIIQSLTTQGIIISVSERNALKEIVQRLHNGMNSWNPYYMNSGTKLARISTALNNLPYGSVFKKELNNPGTELYKAINMQRISPFTLFGSPGFNRSKSLTHMQSAILIGQ